MTIHCKVVSLTYLNTKTLAVCLQADREFEFKAGQYVFIDLGKSGKLPFSIASMPAGALSAEGMKWCKQPLFI
ncbi:hypothetical protein [Photobacterium sanguinicancri]|uniref:hypothetical protein n=1 Tax=Photobacterium sanguinicancri TaxID=875932 RepID=UPI00248073B8|nr:hypothetical protein [Photobacterium sanguinicancri]